MLRAAFFLATLVAVCLANQGYQPPTKGGYDSSLYQTTSYPNYQPIEMRIDSNLCEMDTYGRCIQVKTLCQFGYDQYGYCKPQYKYCRYGEDKNGICRPTPQNCPNGQDGYGNCRLSKYCPFGEDQAGNCRQEPSEICTHGRDQYGKCRQNPSRFCPYGQNQYGSCYPVPQHCRYGQDPYGNCYQAPSTSSVRCYSTKQSGNKCSDDSDQFKTKEYSESSTATNVKN